MAITDRNPNYRRRYRWGRLPQARGLTDLRSVERRQLEDDVETVDVDFSELLPETAAYLLSFEHALFPPTPEARVAGEDVAALAEPLGLRVLVTEVPQRRAYRRLEVTRDRVLELVRERPGITCRELADRAFAVTHPWTRSAARSTYVKVRDALGRLVEERRLHFVVQVGGGYGYYDARVALPAAPAPRSRYEPRPTVPDGPVATALSIAVLGQVEVSPFDEVRYERAQQLEALAGRLGLAVRHEYASGTSSYAYTRRNLRQVTTDDLVSYVTRNPGVTVREVTEALYLQEGRPLTHVEANRAAVLASKATRAGLLQRVAGRLYPRSVEP